MSRDTPAKPPVPKGAVDASIDDTDPAVADTHASEPGATPPSPAGEVRGVAIAVAADSKKGPRQVRSGDSLGRYDLGDELGEGGMATVFRARDRELRRDVAVKVLFPHLARREEVVRRFHREARAAANLEHANILRIYDVGGGTNDDPPYIVMELIRGRTLLEEIEQRGAILAEVVACIGALLADALAAAHAKGIIHRDIKPSNVLIAQGGRLLLADFGVARLETEDSLVTRTGALLGTPAYMSPEQASGDTATAKSDLYSLGATLYQMSTGLLPYSGSPAKVMSQIASGQFVAPVRRSAAVGPDLSRVIEKLMDSDAAARPQSAAVVAAELRQLATAGGLGEPTEELAGYFDDPPGFLKARTPVVVGALVTAGKQALAESRLPRAIAIADRASALAPEDPAVKTLVETVTEGGRASRRRRILAFGGVGVVIAGGISTLAMTLRDGATAQPDAAVMASDVAPIDAVESNAVADAEPVVEPVVDALIAVADAAPIRRFDAGPRTVASIDAAVAPIDAAEPTISIDAAPVAPGDGKVIITNDTWCELVVDGNPYGRIMNRKVVTLPAGRHTLTCSQPGLATDPWTHTIDVEVGKSVAIVGRMLATVEVTMQITGESVQLENVRYRRGAVTKLKPGRYRGVVPGGAAGWVDIPRVPCRLREQGDRLVCDP